jgi:hypothetical protein
MVPEMRLGLERGATRGALGPGPQHAGGPPEVTPFFRRSGASWGGGPGRRRLARGLCNGVGSIDSSLTSNYESINGERPRGWQAP